MGHRCDYVGKLVVEENGDLSYIVTAHWKNKSASVYKVCEDGNQYCRYIAYGNICGYTVTFPGERYKYYYYYGGTRVQEEENWNCCTRLGIWVGSWPTREEDLKTVAEARPDLKYLLQKYKGKNGVELIDLVCMYELHPEIEALVDLGLNHIALNKSFMRYTPKKKKQIVNFIKENKNDMTENTILNQILTCLKNKISYKDYGRFMHAKKDIELFKYLVRKDISPNYYDDYRRMGIRAGHNMDDPYWKFPNDIVKAHNKVMEEIKNIEKIEQDNISNKIEQIAKINIKNNKKINDFSIYIPSNINEIKHQADILNQCLIICDYPKKMANQKSILVFIKKDDNPIATAEIDYSKKILQFYANEKDRNNCKPTEEVKNIFSQWLDGAVIKKCDLNKSLSTA